MMQSETTPVIITTAAPHHVTDTYFVVDTLPGTSHTVLIITVGSVSSYYKWRTYGSDKCQDLPKITQLVNVRAGVYP